jgi:hypothetical protein
VVKVTDILGKEVLNLYHDVMNPGEQSVKVNAGSTLTPGVYFVNLQVNGARMSKKLIIN